MVLGDVFVYCRNPFGASLLSNGVQILHEIVGKGDLISIGVGQAAMELDAIECKLA